MDDRYLKKCENKYVPLEKVLLALRLTYYGFSEEDKYRQEENWYEILKVFAEEIKND